MFKYKESALGAMTGGWSFLSVRVLTLLLVLLVSSRGSFGYWTTSSSPAQHSRQNKSMHKNLPNFGEATTTLYRGGQPSRRGFRILANMGVNIVVDLRGSRDSERKIVTHLGMQYVALPWQCSFPKDKTFAQFLTLLRKNRGKKIFVHCRLGDDRTAMMIASYRMAEEGWSADKISGPALGGQIQIIRTTIGAWWWQNCMLSQNEGPTDFTRAVSKKQSLIRASGNPGGNCAKLVHN